MAADLELQSVVHKHRLFFDSLVELIPAKFYIAKDEHESTWHYGMSKTERAAAKEATKQNLKKAKRDRLDPDKFSSTLQQLQQQEMENGTEDKVEDGISSDRLKGKESRVSSYEELKERLRKRMEMLRAKRNADTALKTAKNAQNWRNEAKKNSQNQNRKRKATSSGRDLEENDGAKNRKYDLENDQINKVKAKESNDNFEFGRVKMGLQNDTKRTKKRRKESKEDLLAKAVKLQSAMQDPEKGSEVALKHSWSAALSRASGEKVLDNPDRIKQSIKREKHQRQKSKKKWEDRKETVKHLVEDRQKTRDEHIKERKQQKKEKKIAKREKKLLRPGFEGRRGGFLNE